MFHHEECSFTANKYLNPIFHFGFKCIVLWIVPAILCELESTWTVLWHPVRFDPLYAMEHLRNLASRQAHHGCFQGENVWQIGSPDGRKTLFWVNFSLDWIRKANLNLVRDWPRVLQKLASFCVKHRQI